ncbi:MAG: DUF692 family protein [Alphaproteobacteria bacterium]|nr:DUF692 family protein [Alphaproteobacteria bacterium]
MTLDALPTLGVGASLSFGADPDPVALARAPGGPSFIEYAGAVQHGWMREPLQALQRLGVPVLYHPSCLNLCGPYANPPAWLEAVDAHVKAVGSAWLAQDVAVCFVGERPGYSIQLGYFVPPILTRASLEEAVQRVQEVRAGVAAPLLLEPAPVTFKLGDMDAFDWLGELALRTDCGLLLDAGHVVSHQLVAGRGLTDGLERLPLDRVIELHVAGGVLQRRGAGTYYIDAHDLPPLPEAWRVFSWLVQRCERLRAVCVECEGSAAGVVLPMLQKARERVAFGAASEALREAARRELSG